MHKIRKNNILCPPMVAHECPTAPEKKKKKKAFLAHTMREGKRTMRRKRREKTLCVFFFLSFCLWDLRSTKDYICAQILWRLLTMRLKLSLAEERKGNTKQCCQLAYFMAKQNLPYDKKFNLTCNFFEGGWKCICCLGRLFSACKILCHGIPIKSWIWQFCLSDGNTKTGHVRSVRTPTPPTRKEFSNHRRQKKIASIFLAQPILIGIWARKWNGNTRETTRFTWREIIEEEEEEENIVSCVFVVWMESKWDFSSTERRGKISECARIFAKILLLLDEESIVFPICSQLLYLPTYLSALRKLCGGVSRYLCSCFFVFQTFFFFSSFPPFSLSLESVEKDPFLLLLFLLFLRLLLSLIHSQVRVGEALEMPAFLR